MKAFKNIKHLIFCYSIVEFPQESLLSAREVRDVLRGAAEKVTKGQIKKIMKNWFKTFNYVSVDTDRC